MVVGWGLDGDGGERVSCPHLAPGGASGPEDFGVTGSKVRVSHRLVFSLYWTHRGERDIRVHLKNILMAVSFFKFLYPIDFS